MRGGRLPSLRLATVCAMNGEHASPLSSEEREAVLSRAVSWWLGKGGRRRLVTRTPFRAVVARGRTRYVLVVDEIGDVSEEDLTPAPGVEGRGPVWRSRHFRIHGDGTLVRTRPFRTNTVVASLRDARAVSLRHEEGERAFTRTLGGGAVRREFSLHLDIWLEPADPMTLRMWTGSSQKRRDRRARHLARVLTAVVAPDTLAGGDRPES